MLRGRGRISTSRSKLLCPVIPTNTCLPHVPVGGSEPQISVGLQDIGSTPGKGLCLQGRKGQPGSALPSSSKRAHSRPSCPGTVRNPALSAPSQVPVTPRIRVPPTISQTCSTGLAAQHLPEVPPAPLFKGTGITPEPGEQELGVG